MELFILSTGYDVLMLHEIPHLQAYTLQLVQHVTANDR